MNESNLYNFFKMVFGLSKTFQGRFTVVEGFGNDLNADNNDDQLINNTINEKPWSKKYPCVVMMPPRETGSNIKNNTSRYLCQLYFCTGTHNTGTGSIKSLNVQTNTSKSTAKICWEEMRNAAGSFKTVMMDMLYSDLSLLQTVRPVKSTQWTFERFTNKNNDQLSGVVATFEMDVVGGCDVTDYVNSMKTLADYATFNSDAFLTGFCGSGGWYSYKNTVSQHNGLTYALAPEQIFKTPDCRMVPEQQWNRITIPAYNTDDEIGLTYDENWLLYLRSIPILALQLIVRPSPFGHLNEAKTDPGFPARMADHALVENVSHDFIYGEGFQFEWDRGDTFSFTIEYRYKANSQVPWTLQHTVIFDERGMTIDGAFVPHANKMEIDEYIF